MISKNLRSEIEAAGFRIKVFKAEHLKEISNGFKMLAEQGILDKDFYENNLADFNYDYKSVLADAKSVMVIASPQHKSIAEFKCNDKTVNAVIPPIYMYPDINSRITGILNNVLAIEGYSFAKPVIPLKLIAVRSGLGRYGRNNVCYMPGLGSFIRLSAYVTDYEFEEDSWGDIKVMESCSNCTACIDNCPAGAIDKRRFLIHAQNCITNFNEYDVPMPEWISPLWHNSIVGCMKCQEACPHNAKLTDLVDERICFDEKETEMILDGSAFDNLPLETRRKISHSGMEEYYNVLPRNIRLLSV
ncbi:MAG: 4Fe-4S double cluster binding domain-containing protein [Clostridiaceae bacterium]|nr:4Fe-4S double cluster binding domain-containing protein [Clostridiaceae bacterium]